MGFIGSGKSVNVSLDGYAREQLSPDAICASFCCLTLIPSNFVRVCAPESGTFLLQSHVIFVPATESGYFVAS
jgi:hypothetical protein